MSNNNTPKKLHSGNKHQWQDDWDKEEQGELNEEVEMTNATNPPQLPVEVVNRIDLEARQFAFYNYVAQVLHPNAVFENMDTWPGDARVCYYSILHYMSRPDLCWPHKEPTLATEYATKLHQLQRQNEKMKAMAEGWRPLLEETLSDWDSMIFEQKLKDKIKKFLYGE